jgi:TolB-like protein
VWPGVAIEDSNLTVQIAALRKSMGTQPDGHEWISTVPRVGYRLVQPADDLPSGGRPSIAVLPFADFSADAAQGYLADGIVEELITALSRFKTFAVVARNSSFVYRDRPADVRVVGTELGVRYVLEGSVRRAGSKLRVTTQLIDASTGTHIWAETYDGAVDDVLDFQDRITERVIASIEPQIRKSEIERSRRKRPERLDVYELYLRALPLIQGLHAADYSEAIALLERAIELDPTFATALAHASWAHAKRVASGEPAPPGVDDIKACIDLAERAVAADSNDAAVLAIAALHITSVKGDVQRGLDLMMRALALNPNSFVVVNFAGFAHANNEDYDKAIECHLRAVQLSPGASERVWALAGVAGGHLHAGRFEDALIWALRALDASDEYVWAHAILVASYVHLGRHEEAQAALATMLAPRPGLTIAKLWAPNVPTPGTDRYLLEGLRRAGIPQS